MITVLVIIMVNIIQHSFCALWPFSNEYRPRASLSRCVVQASMEYFRPGEVVNFVIPPEEVDTNNSSPILLSTVLLAQLDIQSNWSFIIHKPNDIDKYRHDLQIHQTYGNYIMQIRNVNNVMDYLQFLRLQPSWNPHGRFIIVGMFPNYHDFHQNSKIVRIATALWKYNVINGVVLLPRLGNSSEYDVYSWFPYENGSCGTILNNIRKIDKCSYGLIQTRENWFPEKLPRYFNNCKLLIRTMVFPPFVMGATKVPNTADTYEIDDGIEIRLINYVAAVLKLVPKFTMSGILNDWGFLNQDHGGTGIVGGLATFQYQAAICSMSATPERNAVLDPTTSYLQDALIFCVPHADHKSQLKRIIQIMHVHTWILITVTILLFTIIIYRLSLREKNELNIYKSFGANLQRMFAISLGASIHIQPLTSKVRYLLMQWIILSLYLDTAFQTYLISVVTTTVYEPQIKTVDDIIASDLHVLILEVSERFYRKPANIHDQIISRLEHCPNLESCLSRAALKRDAVVIAPRLYTKYVMNKYIRRDGTSLLYCFQESIVTFPIVMYLQRGFPLTKRLSKVIEIVESSGYFDLWRKSIFSNRFDGDFNDAEEDVEVRKQALTMLQLKIAFLLYIGGIGCSIVIFLAELVFKNVFYYCRKL